MSRPHRTKGNASGIGIGTRTVELVAHARSADEGMAPNL